jgi:S-adenosyl-L-methionine hydrolase (adenosine-forming)
LTSTGASAGGHARGTDRISFLSDFGLEDEFVGIVHAVIDRIAPGTRVLDLTHGVGAHDVRSGAMTLWRSAPWLVPGVVLAVVDPGVGTSRRAVALEVASVSACFVGPDNGLLLPAALRLGPVTRAVCLADSKPSEPGATFAGRDLFAPAAARLAAGVPIGELGEAMDPTLLIGTAFEGPVLEPGEAPALFCHVTWIDRFGNAQLNASIEDYDLLGRPGRVDLDRPESAGHLGVVPVTLSYGDLEAGQLGMVIDSYRMLSLCFREESAAARLALREGETVRLRVPVGAP